MVYPKHSPIVVIITPNSKLYIPGFGHTNNTEILKHISVKKNKVNYDKLLVFKNTNDWRLILNNNCTPEMDTVITHANIVMHI